MKFSDFINRFIGNEKKMLEKKQQHNITESELKLQNKAPQDIVDRMASNKRARELIASLPPVKDLCDKPVFTLSVTPIDKNKVMEVHSSEIYVVLDLAYEKHCNQCSW
jgi:hypothetical protein